MKLKQWLVENRVAQKTFAETIGVTPAYVSYLVRDMYWPSKLVLERISLATAGEVTANDFMQDDETVLP